MNVKPLGTSVPTSSVGSTSPQGRTLFQTHELGALLAGGYSITGVTLRDVLKYGDFGLGTFRDYEGGEMVLIGGRFFSCKSPWLVTEPSLDTETPFAMVTRFNPDRSIFVKDIPHYEALKNEIDSRLKLDPSLHYAAQIQGTFESLSMQCVQNPQVPNLPFAQVTQFEGTLDGVKATLAGFRVGDISSSINKPGYHFHGVADEGSFGGHVLAMRIVEATISVQPLESIQI